MKQKLTITLSIILAAMIIFFACKDEELPEIPNNSKIQLTITEDLPGYVTSVITCNLSELPPFGIEQHGFCWDTISGVDIDKQSKNFGQLNNQSFKETIDGLLPNKTYHIKAFIQSSDVIIYSNELTIQTLDARPVVTTNDVINIKANRAESGGTATAPELFPITQRGVCWAKTENPIVSDSITIDSLENDTFSSVISNLEAGEFYYVRAYAINSEGIGYGEEKIFETLDGNPDLTTDSITDITATSATFYGDIENNDGLEILEKGFCWSTIINPTIDNNFISISGDELGIFYADVSGLDIDKTYNVRAYLKNSEGTFYGNQITFTTKDGIPDLTTTAITDTTATTATSGGNITDDGGFAITARGVCWSTSPNPEIIDAHTTDGSGTGSFTSTLTSLDVNTSYYVRSYATNSNGTTYGDEKSFTTLDGFPTITTAEVTEITANSAISGGIIEDDGGLDITARGLCWSISQNPTISDEHTTDGTGIGSFTSNLTGLDTNTTYYVRSYATNEFTIVYGDEINFTTKDGIPELTTNEITDITITSATSGGNITNDGGFSITARGVCWSTNPEPTISDSHTIDGEGTGSFTSTLTSLDTNTTYYVRAYATNEVGTVYGGEKSFTTLDGLPSGITTSNITDITVTSATSGGSISDDGGFSITARGVCWSTNQNPTITDAHSTDGTGIGNFTSSLTTLDANTTYYVRAYATNEVGTVYGGEKSFTTLDGLPSSISTNNITDITVTSATSGGSISDDGGFSITARGVCWSTSTNPTIANAHTTDGSGTGSFTSSLTGLAEGTTYYVRAYATNSMGTSYGDQRTFTTLNEGDVYNPTTGKVWMDRNLGATQVATSSTDANAYGDLYQWGRAADGHESRTSGTTTTLSSSDTPGHGNFITVGSDPYDWRSPQNDNLWQGVNGTNNPCPAGYRLPTEAEWEAERQSWSSNDEAGAFASPLKLPVAGRRYSGGSLNLVGSSGYYWSSTVDGTRSRLLYFHSSNADMGSKDRAGGDSVRCLKD